MRSQLVYMPFFKCEQQFLGFRGIGLEFLSGERKVQKLAVAFGVVQVRAQIFKSHGPIGELTSGRRALKKRHGGFRLGEIGL